MNNLEPSVSPNSALELRQIRWEIAQVKADLQFRIIDVELRLAWLRLYGIWAAGTAVLLIIAAAMIVSQ